MPSVAGFLLVRMRACRPSSKVLRESSLRKELYAGVVSQRVISKRSNNAARGFQLGFCLLVSYMPLAVYARNCRDGA